MKLFLKAGFSQTSAGREARGDMPPGACGVYLLGWRVVDLVGRNAGGVSQNLISGKGTIVVPGAKSMG